MSYHQGLSEVGKYPIEVGDAPRGEPAHAMAEVRQALLHHVVEFRAERSLAQIVAVLRRFLPIDAADYTVLAEKGGTTMMLVQCAGRHAELAAVGRRLDRALALRLETLRRRAPILVEDTYLDVRYSPLPLSEPFNSQALVPVWSELRGHGVLSFESDERLQAADLTLLQGLGDLIVGLIEGPIAATKDVDSGTENTTIAHEIHDTVIQNLTAARMLAESIPGMVLSNKPALDPAAHRMADLVRCAIAELRQLIVRLDPGSGHGRISCQSMSLLGVEELRNGSLEGAALRIVSRMLPEGVELRSCFSNYQKQPLLTELTLLRIIQESVSNALKHAEPGFVEISATVDASGTRVGIVNNGKARNTQSTKRGGMGLRSMIERMEAMGGRLTAYPGTAEGFAVEAYLPADRHPSGSKIL